MIKKIIETYPILEAFESYENQLEFEIRLVCKQF